MKSRRKGSISPENTPRSGHKASDKATIYLSTELKEAIDEQRQQEGESRSGLISNIMDAILLSPVGKQLRKDTNDNNRPIADYILENFLLYSEGISRDEIRDLARKTRRNPMQMVEFLIALGLKIYTSKTPTDAEVFFLKDTLDTPVKDRTTTDEN